MCNSPCRQVWDVTLEADPWDTAAGRRLLPLLLRSGAEVAPQDWVNMLLLGGSNAVDEGGGGSPGGQRLQRVAEAGWVPRFGPTDLKRWLSR